jgi:hypothetical protein
VVSDEDSLHGKLTAPEILQQRQSQVDDLPDRLERPASLRTGSNHRFLFGTREVLECRARTGYPATHKAHILSIIEWSSSLRLIRSTSDLSM